MRRRLAVPLIAAAGLAPWFWFHPEAPPPDLPARRDAVIAVPRDADWLGGLSGLDLAADGSRFQVVTDRGHRAEGRLLRENGRLAGMVIDRYQRLRDPGGVETVFPFTDAESLSFGPNGEVYVSFEQVHRVLVYDDWDGPARWAGYTRAWRALSNNAGLEALAVSEDGTLYVIPEQINGGATEALVYRRTSDGTWKQAFTLPVDGEFRPVGADFGPDGRLYLLERGLYPVGFYSRVRAMTVRETGFSGIETVMQTRLWTHGNLEGLAVWRDAEGLIRLTMVSDDNFLPVLPGEIVEYVLPARLAKPAE
jgi:hypothetical protein